MTKIQPSAVLMAATHLLTRSERTETNSDIFDNYGTYRTSRLREISRLAWDLARMVEAETPQKEPAL